MRQHPAAYAFAAGFSAFVLGFAPANAQASGTAPAGGVVPGQAGLGYEIYAGGLHVLTFDLDLKIAPQTYVATARYGSTGFLGWLIPWTSQSVAAGTVTQDKLVPERYRVDSKLRGRERVTDIFYADGQVNDVKLMPLPKDDEDREIVTDEQKQNTFDPMTAIFAATRNIDRGQSCTSRLPVFDGRRRYDLVLTDAGKQEVRAGYYKAFAGEAVRCDFSIEQVSGFVRKPRDEETHRQLQSGRVWMAPVVAGGPAVPVRLELDGDWGMSIVHLRKFDWHPNDGMRVVVGEDKPK
jgi:hypothetical protein